MVSNYDELLEEKKGDYNSGTEPWIADLLVALLNCIEDAALYLEIGYNRGTTTNWVLERCPNISAVAIDVRIERDRMCHPRCKTHEGDSTKVLPALDITPDLTYVDGSHRHDGVTADIRNSIDKGSKVIVVHDLNMDGVRTAVEEVAAERRGEWYMMRLRTRKFPWYPVTGIAIFTRREVK